MNVDALSAAVELRAQRVPHVLATVVWRLAPSSGQVGAKAVVLADGSVRGWMGGACAEPAVVRQAIEALADGKPRLVAIGDEASFGSGTNATMIGPTCESDGALEVYLEPQLPQPAIVAVGRSPAVDALVAVAAAVGWEARAVDDVPVAELTAADGATAVVVATQGRFDAEALTAALDSDAGYIGLVASAPRAAELLERLAAAGRSDVSRVHAPAGRDLGSVTNAEIAVSLMAELVERRARGELVATGAPVAPVVVIDPVCGMTVDLASARYRLVHDGAEVLFCAAGCMERFEADPTQFAST